MVQAIVFLPLLGAILAGLIAIYGAHARNPSGDAVEHHHDDAHGAHAHAAGAHDDHGHDDHDDHHVSEPPAQGSRAAELITTGLLFVSAALSWVTLVDVGFLHHDYRIALFPWINSGDLLNIDNIGAMSANELLLIQYLFKMIHCFVLQEIPLLCMDLYIIVSCFEEKNIIGWNDLDLASVLYYDPLTLCR